MAKGKVIGTRKLDFEINGQKVKGINIFVTFEDSSKDVEGLLGKKVFVPEDSELRKRLPVFKFGTEYDFVYDVTGFGGKGKLVDIKPCVKSAF